MTDHPVSSTEAEAATMDDWRHTPGAAYPAQPHRLTAQLTAECDAIATTQREGRITSTEATGMTEAAHKRYDTALALARIGRDHPRWHTWTGVNGILYARIPMSSPPIVVRASTVGALRTLVAGKDAVLRP